MFIFAGFCLVYAVEQQNLEISQAAKFCNHRKAHYCALFIFFDFIYIYIYIYIYIWSLKILFLFKKKKSHLRGCEFSQPVKIHRLQNFVGSQPTKSRRLLIFATCDTPILFRS